MASEERTRPALLAGLTALALVLGAWWWRSAAPSVDPATAASRPPAGADQVPSGWAVDPATGDARPAPNPAVVEIDPRSGRVVTEPDRSVVIHVEGDGGTLQGQVSHVVWRETSLLTPGGQPVVRQANPSQGDEYRMSVSCSGDGMLGVSVSGTGADDLDRVVDCGGRLDVSIVGGSGAPVRVRFSALRDEVELDARLEALY
ncbi:hypothetical protein [Micromonospora sediminicola]|uniref:hypothetical protein n=1 Tax=Micromonospora sediminicola TaxID=946078 RepID=UPI0034004B73